MIIRVCDYLRDEEIHNAFLFVYLHLNFEVKRLFINRRRYCWQLLMRNRWGKRRGRRGGSLWFRWVMRMVGSSTAGGRGRRGRKGYWGNGWGGVTGSPVGRQGGGALGWRGEIQRLLVNEGLGRRVRWVASYRRMDNIVVVVELVLGMTEIDCSRWTGRLPNCWRWSRIVAGFCTRRDPVAFSTAGLQ